MCSNNTAELTGFAEAIRWTNDPIPAANVYAFSTIPNMLHEWLWVWPTPKGTWIWATGAMLFC